MSQGHFTIAEAGEIADKIGIDFSTRLYDVEQFRDGINVEMEHGSRDAETNVTGDDPIMTGKIALAHLNEFPDYYVRLAKMELEAEAYWKDRQS